MSQIAPIGYKGQKYVAICTFGDDKDFRIGWTEDPECPAFKKMVELHPSMSDLVIREVLDEQGN